MPLSVLQEPRKMKTGRVNRSFLRPHMAELQTLRGLVCLAALFFHGLWWYIPQTATGIEGRLRDGTQGGYRGVNLFFVLSGLLITNLLLESREHPDYFSRFYKRRVLRILPPYYTILILLAIYGMPHRFLGVSHLANMAPLLGIRMGYGPLWSLAVEEQFYLLFPLFVRKLSLRLLVFAASAIFVSSILLGFGLHTNSPQATFPIWYSAHGLALGALLAIFLRSKFGRFRNTLMAGIGLATSGVILLIASHRNWARPQTSGILEGSAWDFLFAALLLFALLLGSSKFEAWTRPRILLFFGEISYGLYLIHVLVFMTYRRVFQPASDLRSIVMEFLVCCLVSIGLATLSRFTVEAWFLGLKDKPLWRLAELRSRTPITNCELRQ